MKTAKIIIFIIGVFLINYVGGMPTDSRNLFISHGIFFAPFLVDFHPLLSVKNALKYLIIPVYFAGIIALVSNILGITGMLIVNEDKSVTFSSDYYVPFSLDISVNNYLLFCGIVYAAVFVGTLTLTNQIGKEPAIKEKKETGKELANNVHI